MCDIIYSEYVGWMKGFSVSCALWMCIVCLTLCFVNALCLCVLSVCVHRVGMARPVSSPITHTHNSTGKGHTHIHAICIDMDYDSCTHKYIRVYLISKYTKGCIGIHRWGCLSICLLFSPLTHLPLCYVFVSACALCVHFVCSLCVLLCGCSGSLSLSGSSYPTASQDDTTR
jgi:hypothetical protein